MTCITFVPAKDDTPARFLVNADVRRFANLYVLDAVYEGPTLTDITVRNIDGVANEWSETTVVVLLTQRCIPNCVGPYLGEYRPVGGESGTVEKQLSAAFHRYHSRLQRPPTIRRLMTKNCFGS